jgi:cell division protein FtsB
VAVSARVIERNRKLRRWLRYSVLGIIALIFLAIGYAFYVQINTVLGLQNEYHDLQQELGKAQEINNRLAQQLLLKDDTEYLEYLARKWLGLIKPGETKVILPPN